LKQFLSQKISILDHQAIILTSNLAVDHFFRIVSELNITMPADTKYFCTHEGTADYLQKFINYSRKKTYFSENGTAKKLLEKMLRHRSNNFFLPTTMDSSINQLVELLDEKKINYTKAEFFKISFPDVRKKIDVFSYDMLIFFSPYGIQSLIHNYPDFQQGNTVIGVLGTRVLAAAQDAGLNVQIIAPTPKHPSILSAVDNYLKKTTPRWKIKQ